MNSDPCYAFCWTAIH
ncbi:hypothetical protein PO124_25095 [Bacillus licheniformis]|nr:hypothetical protein [Bacillus licheniformis]